LVSRVAKCAGSPKVRVKGKMAKIKEEIYPKVRHEKG
jgi:hypothetical protein